FFKIYFLDVLTKHYVDFKGRANRKEFWAFALFAFIPIVLLVFSGYFPYESLGLRGLRSIMPTVFFLLAIALILPTMSIATRRLHDTDKRGWWQLIFIVPFIAFLFSSLMLAMSNVIRLLEESHVIGGDPQADPAAAWAALYFWSTVTMIVLIIVLIALCILIVFLCMASKEKTRFDNELVKK
ncbi:MAG: DUF805 domain-containing protein, partial [Elusimicrobiota bacterium]|nr:DUF805 domain-containing protein [Elusimicrobiota bacterium]